MPDDSFNEFFRRTEEATRRSPAEVIASDEADRMSDADFDDALWLALHGRVSSREDLDGLPAGARMYFATRIVEWEAGSGGFGGALEYAGEYLDDAVRGYELLGDSRSVELWRRVIAARDDGEILDRLMDDAQGPPWEGVPWGDAKRVAYVRAHREDFRIR